MKRSHFFTVAIIVAISLCCSSKPTKPCSFAEFSDYFVSPTISKYDTLTNRIISLKTLGDSLVAFRALAPKGILRTEVSDTFGAPYSIGWQTPLSFKADSLYPLIIYLHGGTATERTNKGDSAFFMMKALADTMPLFLASPSANRYAQWWTPAGLARILQTVRFMTLRYPIDPDRIFLAGVSDGATGCYAAANTIPRVFAGFFAVSGYGGMLPNLGMPLSPENLGARSFYNINAGNDRIYPLEMVKSFVHELMTNKIAVDTAWYPNEEHGFDYRAREMGNFAARLRSWRKPHRTHGSWRMMSGYPNSPDVLDRWKTKESSDAHISYSLRDNALTLDVSSCTHGACAVSFDTKVPSPLAVSIMTSNGAIAKTVHPDISSPLVTLKNMVTKCLPHVSPHPVFSVSW